MTPEFQRLYDLDALAGKGREEKVTANREELKALAKRAGLPAVNSLEASFSCKAGSLGVYDIEGEFRAKVIQTCSRSGKDFEAQIEGRLRTLFIAPEAFAKMDSEEVESLEDYEILDRDKADIGEVIAQFFLLALDPYPVFEGDISEKIATSGIKVLSEAEAKQDQNPFSKLKELQKKT